MKTDYESHFGCNRVVEGHIDIVETVDRAAEKGPAIPKAGSKKAASYEAACMGSSGYAMTTVEIIRK